MHEVAWARLLGRAVGHTTLGIGLALAAFMIGSGLGALLVARTPLWRRPRMGYALVEAVIGVGALGLLGYCLAGPLPSAALGGGLAVDVLVAGLVALLPAIGMGATYPLLVATAAESGASSVRALYAASLAGALVGTLLSALVTAPLFGLDGTGLAATVLNLAVAALAPRMLADGRAGPAPRLDAQDREALARFAAAGLIGLGAQAVWNRALLPYAGVSVLTFASIVAVYLAAQALGFALYARLPDRSRDTTGAFGMALAPALALLTLGGVSVVGDAMPDRDTEPLAWLARVFGVVALVVGPVALALGVAQAAALARVEARSGDWGARAGRVAGAGTIVSALGALFASTVGLSQLGPRGTLAALALAPLFALFAARRHALPAGLGLVAAALLAWIAPGPAWFLGPSFDGAPLLYAEHGTQDTTAVVTVDRPLEPRIRRLVANGVSYSGDSIFAQRYMRLLAHLPALASRGEARALVICVGTGTTLDALRAHPFEHIDAVDISPTIHESLSWFRHVHHDAHVDPRVTLIVDDGARWLRRAPHAYDVITLEPPPPRAPGASSLYSQEFYRAARARLAPGGVVAQWIPLHGMSSTEVAALVRTFVAELPHASLHLAERNEAVLVGGPEPLSIHDARAARERVRADLARIGFDRDPWRDTLVLGGPALARLVDDAPLVRDVWPMPEYAPLAGARREGAPLDAWLERVASASQAEPGSFAALLMPAVPAFVRVEEGRARANDRAFVVRAMEAWRARSPDDPYVQHAFGRGPLLEARLERLRDELGARELDAVRRALRRP